MAALEAVRVATPGSRSLQGPRPFVCWTAARSRPSLARWRVLLTRPAEHGFAVALAEAVRITDCRRPLPRCGWPRQNLARNGVLVPGPGRAAGRRAEG
jgi:hypothetical protein